MKLIILFLLFWWLLIFLDTSLKKLFRKKHEAVFLEAEKWLTTDRFNQGVLQRAFYYFVYSVHFWPVPSFAIFLLASVAIIFF
ncbi:hypothetical protein [Methylophilus sp.]|jgi:hypothetical protein|uniref:hypothetical protein n=1 Tax=Methylophilus sp. TaxID=29541 RepID=UPI0011D99F61|nr:hypothetical protein [Methylophilus sp.]TXI44785.1 MAG: hypothetical protein E6Q52_07910 [Methylophilus sp.]